MEVLLGGTGGPAGWPVAGCGCASCRRLSLAGRRHAPTRVVVDGVLPVGEGVAPAGYALRTIPGGQEVTTPDGGRLLCAAGPGASPDPPPGGAPYDVALLDLLAEPHRLGALRRRGLITSATTVAPVQLDHRVPSAGELARRLRLWGARRVRDGDVLRGGGCGYDPYAPRRTMVLGGAGSGKSAEAELRLAGAAQVTYLATAHPSGDEDPEWRRRVLAHRARRPSWWRTEETLDLAGALRAARGVLLVDGIGTWLAGVMDARQAWREGVAAVTGELDALIAAWRETRAHVVAVSDEVGSGVVPTTQSGRLFRDLLGRLNQRLTAESEEAVLVVAGRVVELPA